MSTRWLTALLALAAAIVGALVWVAPGERVVERTEVAAREPSANSRANDAALADAGLLQAALAPASTSAAEAPAESAASVTPAPPPAESARNAVRSAYELELDAARWVEGRVLFPPGTPADEHAVVVAKGKGFQHGPPHRVAVAADGSFRVAFAAGTAVGRLELEARYLSLERPERVTLDEGPVRVELVPALGGALCGRLVPPQGSADLATLLAGTKLTLELTSSAGPKVDDAARFLGAEIGSNLDFELGGLAAGAYRIALDLATFVPVRVEDVAIELGRVTTLDVPLESGVTLAGSVLDDAGQPVAGAEVQAFADRSKAPERIATSDEDGAFVLRGLVPARIELYARQRGFEDASIELGALADGEVRAGIELVLDPGLSIAGQVLWPDGTSAAGALVRVSPEDGQDSVSLFGRRWTADADGRFRIGGLDAGTFRLEASAASSASVVVTDPLTLQRSERPEETTLRATTTGVAAGTEGLVLALNTGAIVRGRVVDELGQPVPEFTLHARRTGAWAFSTEGELTGDFVDPSGRFELAGFQPGEWQVGARTSKGRASAPLVVEVPGALDSLELVLCSGGSLAGEARDADGRVLAGREIEVQSLAANHFETLVTDDAGRFFAEFVPAGDCRVRLCARDPDIRALLAPGQDPGPLERTVSVTIVEHETAQVTLTLPDVEPVRVTGRVRVGDQPVRASISFRDRGENGGSTACVADEEGRYAIVLGRPGSYLVSLATENGLTHLDAVEVPAVPSFEIDLTLAVGRISGQVRDLAHEPIAGIGVEALGSRTAFPLKSGRSSTDENGRYTLLVPAGTYVVKAGGGGFWVDEEGVVFGESRVEGIVVEPDARLEDVDFVLEPGGAVEGVVRWEDGSNAGGGSVHVFDANGARIAIQRITPEGRFLLEGIRPGPCVIEAIHQRPMAFGRTEVHVSASQNGPVEIVLRRATFVVVKTLDGAGAEVAAEVEVVDALGRKGRATRIDGSVGLTSLGPLELGSYTLRARREGSVLEKTIELAGDRPSIQGQEIPLTVEMVFR